MPGIAIDVTVMIGSVCASGTDWEEISCAPVSLPYEKRNSLVQLEEKV
jgi:hypothetical protein